MAITQADIDALKEINYVSLNVNNVRASVIFPMSIHATEDTLPVLNEVALLIKSYEQDNKEALLTSHAHGSFMLNISAQDASPDDSDASLRFRVQSFGDNVIYALRNTVTKLEVFDDIVKNDRVKEILTQIELKKSGGLIIVCGAKGSGKSTLAYAAIVKRLELFGGFCLGIEDPPEISAAFGFHGNKGGFFAQMDASRMGYAEAIVHGLRAYPLTEGVPMMFIGEIRDEESATEALRAALSGALLITTFHSDSAINAIKRILALAQSREPDAKSLLGASLKYVIVQDKGSTSRIQSSAVEITALLRGCIERGEFNEFQSALSTQMSLKRAEANRNSTNNSSPSM